MLMFISFPSILESGLSWGHWHLFNLIEHQPTGCVNILSKRPLPVGASFTRDLASTARSYKKHTTPFGAKKSLCSSGAIYL